MKTVMAKLFEPSDATANPTSKERENKREDKGVDLSLIPGSVNGQSRAMPVHSGPGRVPLFQLYLAAPQKTGEEVLAQLAQRELRGHGERVLFVDDEDSMVFLMERWLDRLGYKATVCTAPEKALEIFRAAPQDFDVVLSDLSMPEMSGVELARELLQIRPGVPILIVSGYVAAADNEEVRSLGLPDLLPKPNSIEQLAQSMHSILAMCKSSNPAGQTRTPGRMAAAAGS